MPGRGADCELCRSELALSSSPTTSVPVELQSITEQRGCPCAGKRWGQLMKRRAQTQSIALTGRPGASRTLSGTLGSVHDTTRSCCSRTRDSSVKNAPTPVHASFLVAAASSACTLLFWLRRGVSKVRNLAGGSGSGALGEAETDVRRDEGDGAGEPLGVSGPSSSFLRIASNRTFGAATKEWQCQDRAEQGSELPQWRSRLHALTVILRSGFAVSARRSHLERSEAVASLQARGWSRRDEPAANGEGLVSSPAGARFAPSHGERGGRD